MIRALYLLPFVLVAAALVVGGVSAAGYLRHWDESLATTLRAGLVTPATPIPEAWKTGLTSQLPPFDGNVVAQAMLVRYLERRLSLASAEVLADVCRLALGEAVADAFGLMAKYHVPFDPPLNPAGRGRAAVVARYAMQCRALGLDRVPWSREARTALTLIARRLDTLWPRSR